MTRKKRYFQWIAGDNMGAVETLIGINEVDGEYFYMFESGEVMNVRYISPITSDRSLLKEKFMVEVNNRTNLWSFSEIKSRGYRDETTGQNFEIPPIEDTMKVSGNGGTIDESAVGKMNLIPPAKQQKPMELPDYEEWACDDNGVLFSEIEAKRQSDAIIESAHKEAEIKPVLASVSDELTKVEELPTAMEKAQQNGNLELPTPMGSGVIVNVRSNPLDLIRESTPVEILIDKCKKHSTDIELSVKVDLPSKQVFGIASEEFGATAEEFVSYITSKIDSNIIIESLKNALVAAYNNSGAKEPATV